MEIVNYKEDTEEFDEADLEMIEDIEEGQLWGTVIVGAVAVVVILVGAILIF